MPGLVGLIKMRPREWAEQQLHRMLAPMRHEPFYRCGVCVDECRGIYVGWTARQGSFAECLPLCNERGDVVLFFAGEDFPDPDATRRLRRRGHRFGGSGAAYLPHAYEDDPSFPAGLNGRFHGLVVDRRRGDTLLFTDRYGMQRLYYTHADDAFYFAAEAKAILAVVPEHRRLDLQSAGELLTCGCVLENRTLFDGIRTIPPAAAWVFRGGTLASATTYFNPREWEQQPVLDAQSYYGELRRTFAANLPRYFRADEPIAVSLTGGLDSRMIMAWQRSESGSLPCYTFGGPYRECQDVVIARRVARACGQPHQVITLGGGFLERFASYAERTVFLTDGCADVSRAPDLYVNERARAIAPVRMAGLYGGEVLRRVRAFKPILPARGLLDAAFVTHLDAASAAYSRAIDTHPLSFAAFRQCPWHYYGILSLEQTQVTLRSPFLDNDFVKTVFRAPASATTTDDVCLRLIADGNPVLRGIRTDRGVGGNGVRAALSRAWLELLFKAEYACDYGLPQPAAALTRPLEPLGLERLFLGRHKFYHFRTWYQGALADYLQSVLLDSRALSRPHVDGRGLARAVRRHVAGSRNYTMEIHKLLTLELVHRLFIDHR